MVGSSSIKFMISTYRVDDLVEVEEHSCVTVCTTNEPKPITKSSYDTLKGERREGGGGEERGGGGREEMGGGKKWREDRGEGRRRREREMERGGGKGLDGEMGGAMKRSV